MRYLLLGFMMFVSFLQGEEFKGTPAGLLTFSKHIPIEMDAPKEVFSQIKRNEEIDQAKKFPWARLFFGLTAALGFFALRYYPQEKEEKTIAVKTAKDKAKQQIELLKAENLSLNQQYEKLNDILRQFIEQRYGIKAPTKTTEEFLAMIKEDPSVLQPFSEQAFSQVLMLSDLVKFAKEHPSQDDYRKAYALLEQFIDL